MPRFAPDGPDLPDALLHALEDDRLVFLCGAGISIGTGLPSFRGLVAEAYKARNVPLEGEALDCVERGELDKALDLLEQKEGRDAGLMRRFVCERLVRDPPGDAPDRDLALHRALLELARRPSAPGGTARGRRLVTTNFDDRFARAGLKPEEMEDAPRLGPPRFDRLRRVVFLHGRIRPDDPFSGEELVLTSRDFGNAYLRDGWAARFVLELLREFDLLLVGYSLSDPVMRYLVDAIAPESRPAGQFRQIWALASFDPKTDPEGRPERDAWSAKNVRPILYPAPASDHALLRRAVVEVARIVGGGAQARAALALEILRDPAPSEPRPRSPDLLAWALGEESGRTARIVVDAALDPSRPGSERPHVSWLCPLIAAEIHDPRESRDPEARCKLRDLPGVEAQLRRWFEGSLGDLDLVRDVVSRDRPIPAAWLSDLEHWFKSRPPEPLVRQFWAAYAAAALPDLCSSTDPGRLLQPGEGQDPPSPHRLRTVLAARLRGPEPPWSSVAGLPRDRPPTCLSDLARFKLCRVRDRFEELPSFDDASKLVLLLDELTSEFAEHCRLAHLADCAPGWHSEWWIESLDMAGSALPSEDSEVLASWLVRGFEAASEKEPEIAQTILRRWHLLWRVHGYGIFARLWLWGVARHPRAEARNVLDWLREEPGRLWEREWKRELRLWLIRRGAELGADDIAWLWERIGNGPPGQATGSNAANAPAIEFFVDRHLEALQRSGASVPERWRERTRQALRAVEEHNQRLRKRNEDWPFDEVGPLERVVRPVEPARLPDIETLGPDEIAQAIRIYRDRSGGDHGAAQLLADAVRRSKHAPSAIADALLRVDEQRAEVWSFFWSGLAGQHPDPAGDMEALIELARRSPPMLDRNAASDFAGWLTVVAAKDLGERRHEHFLAAWDTAWERAVAGSPAEPQAEPTTTTAITGAPDTLAWALLLRLGKARRPGDAGLPKWFKDRAEPMFEDTSAAHILAIVTLSHYLFDLFGVDEPWTKEHLLPLLDPEGSPQTAGPAWEGYLRGPRYDAALVEALAPKLLAMAHRRETIPNWGAPNFQALLVLASMDYPAAFPQTELWQALIALGPDALADVLRVVGWRLVKVGDEAAELWRSRVGPWIERSWPGERRFREGKAWLAANQLLLHTREAFPEALRLLRDKGLVHPDTSGDASWKLASQISRLVPGSPSHRAESGYDYVSRHPAEVVAWLGSIIDPKPLDRWTRADVLKALERVPDSTRGVRELRDALR